MNRIMSAIEGVSDRYIEKFAVVESRKKVVPMWLKYSSVVAGLAILTLTAVLIGVYNTSSSHSFSQTDSSVNNVQPKVIFGGECYILAPKDTVTDDLPEGYVLVGEILSNNKSDAGKEGYSWGCHPGEKIYQDLSNPQELYVYTTFFTGTDDEFCYVRFVEPDYYFGRLKE